MSTTVDFSANRGPEVHVIGWGSTGIGIFTVVLKLIARASIAKRIGWDDFFIFLSMACSIVAAAFVSYSITLGLGRHTQAVVAEYGKDRLVETAKWQILGFPFNIASFSFPNISIAILVNNVLDPNYWRSGMLLGLCIVQVVLAMISVCLIYLQCSPAEGLWNPYIESVCWNPATFNDFNYFVSGYTAFTDFVLAFVPIAAFWNLQMPTSTKLGVCFMMALTLLSAIVTVIKATYLHLFEDHTDPLYNVVPLVIWGLIEQNVVIVAACVPTVRPIFHRAFRAWTMWSWSDKSTSHTPSSPPAYRLSSIPVQSHDPGHSKRLTSALTVSMSEQETYIPEEDTSDHHIVGTRRDRYSESSSDSANNINAIWETREVRVQCHDEQGLDLEGGRMSRVVPQSLRAVQF